MLESQPTSETRLPRGPGLACGATRPCKQSQNLASSLMPALLRAKLQKSAMIQCTSQWHARVWSHLWDPSAQRPRSGPWSRSPLQAVTNPQVVSHACPSQCKSLTICSATTYFSMKCQSLDPPVRPVCPEAPVWPVEPLAPAISHNASHIVRCLIFPMQSSDNLLCYNILLNGMPESRPTCETRLPRGPGLACGAARPCKQFKSLTLCHMPALLSANLWQSALLQYTSELNARVWTHLWDPSAQRPRSGLWSRSPLQAVTKPQIVSHACPSQCNPLTICSATTYISMECQSLDSPVRPVCPEAPVWPVEPLAPASSHRSSICVTCLPFSVQISDNLLCYNIHLNGMRESRSTCETRLPRSPGLACGAACPCKQLKGLTLCHMPALLRAKLWQSALLQYTSELNARVWTHLWDPSAQRPRSGLWSRSPLQAVTNPQVVSHACPSQCKSLTICSAPTYISMECESLIPPVRPVCPEAPVWPVEPLAPVSSHKSSICVTWLPFSVQSSDNLLCYNINSMECQSLDPPVRPVCPEAPAWPVEPLAPASSHKTSHCVTRLPFSVQISDNLLCSNIHLNGMRESRPTCETRLPRSPGLACGATRPCKQSLSLKLRHMPALLRAKRW